MLLELQQSMGNRYTCICMRACRACMSTREVPIPFHLPSIRNLIGICICVRACFRMVVAQLHLHMCLDSNRHWYLNLLLHLNLPCMCACFVSNVHCIAYAVNRILHCTCIGFVFLLASALLPVLALTSVPASPFVFAQEFVFA